MALSFGKRDVAKMVAILDQDHDTIEEAALAALDAAMALIEGKAKFTVVSQINGEGDKVALGWFSTALQANGEAMRATYSTATHEAARAWVLPLHHGTPHAYYTQRKNAAKAATMSERSWREKEMQRRVAWFDKHPGEEPPEEWGLMPAYDSEVIECPSCNGTGKVRKNED